MKQRESLDFRILSSRVKSLFEGKVILKSYLLSVWTLILFGASATHAKFQAASCLDIMTQGFYRLPAMKRVEDSQKIWDLLRDSVTNKDYRTFRAALVELIHMRSELIGNNRKFHISYSSHLVSFDSEYIYFQKNWFLPKQKLVHIQTVFENSVHGDFFQYQRDMVDYAEDYGWSLKKIDPDRRIKMHFRNGGSTVLTLNFKNETAVSLRLFLARFNMAEIRYRKGGKVVYMTVPTSKVEYSLNGDVFVSGKFVFNLYGIMAEESSFYFVTLRGPKGHASAVGTFKETPEVYNQDYN